MIDGLDGEHLQLRYMTRFHCIGPDCEDHCCYGWRVDIDREHYRRMMAAAQYSTAPVRTLIRDSLEVVPGSKRKKTPTRYVIKHDKDSACPLLDERHLCQLHKHFGHDMLSDVCAIYPRKLKRVGDHLELSATPSCPELSRELLLAPDAADIIPLDLKDVFRIKIQGGMDTRDSRPFFKSVITVRDQMVGLLADESMSIEQRLFLMLWFAKRTNDLLSKYKTSGDLAPVERELGVLRNPAARREIITRFERLRTPASLTLMLVRAIVRPNPRGLRPAWNRLVAGTIDSYTRLRELVPRPDEALDAHERAAQDNSERVMMKIGEVWAEYRRRRDAIRARVGARADQYLRNYALHNWFHRLPTETTDLMTYTMRFLALQACQKFLLYSDPGIVTLLGELEGLPRQEGDARLREALDARMVDVSYQLSRHIEHGIMLKYLAKLLRQASLFSMAGGVFLIRF